MSTRTAKNLLFIITIAFFISGFVNITFSLLALLCMVIPFIMVYRDRKLSWCQGACPRADYLTKIGRFSLRKPVPRSLVSAKTRQIVLSYFCVNLMFIGLSTFMVSQGKLAPIDRVRFLIFLEIPWSLPQLVVLDRIPDVLIHFSYRLYSIMFTSTVLGTVLAILYKPRTWCGVCPMNTMSANVLRNLKRG